MFPLLLIVIGIAVLVIGKRPAVLGAAVGALFGVGLLKLTPATSGPWVTLGVPIALALVGFFGAAFAKGLIDIVVLVIGALAGAAIVMGFLDLFNVDAGLMRWLLAVVGGVVGLILIRRARRGSQDWGIIILAGLVGALLVMRGFTILLPVLQGVSGTLIVIVLAGASIAFQGGILGKRKGAAQAQPTAQVQTPAGGDAPAAKDKQTTGNEVTPSR
jgi:hypothetical protein